MTKPELKDNFYKSINFDWLESNPIPSEYTKWGNFNVLHETNQHRLREILETNNTTDEENKLNILWKKGSDVDELNKQNIINIINTSTTDLTKLILERMDYGMMHLFSVSSYTDMKDSSRTVLYFGPASLGLPDRDYFLLDKMKDKQDSYKDYLKTFLEHCNIDIDYNIVYEFEKSIATIHLPKADCRDPHKIYNKFSFSDLEEQFPGIMWAAIFDRYKLPTNDTIILTQPAFFKFMSDHLLSCYKDQKVYDMTMNYLKYRFAKVASTFIDDKSYNIYFDFYCKTLMGQKEQKVRWKRVLATIDSTLGEVLSKVYIQKYFGEEQKKSCKAMIDEIVKTYKERIKNLDWMSDVTKEKALYKLSKFNVKIGYPDKWTDFSKLIISESLSYFENILECYKWSFEDSISKAYKPVDKLEWHMNAHDINAYYSPTMNEIVFPAGILQEPFYSTSQSLAENLGGIGAVIGHEITHGFDDKGCMFDSDGNLNNWWTDDDTNKFKEKSKKMEDLFASFDYFGINVNGKLTLGENIADLGGITLSLKTLERLVDSDNIKNETKNLFIQWAKIWRCNIMDDSLKNQLLTDPHSPTELRVNGILPNLQEFCDAYDIKMGDKMYIEPEKRSNLW